ncbi:hypothetical protein AVEN_131421-1 [Araneus ventricosus]|uniref:Helitron helicase-like domain-containing protein n=1 Tax=Araneus ventricosus TaxID=182803 RepID=A0A4Y2J985_ARAVE|nr:hypothetical protein AVEN_131421-1 [Araneus ventricosus]
MHEFSQDAIPYVHTHGRPILFITFTCNLKRSEITIELMEDLSPIDRHDLTEKVFKWKLIKLIDVISKSHIFVETRCWMYTVYSRMAKAWSSRRTHIGMAQRKISCNPNRLHNFRRDPRSTKGSTVSRNMIHGPCR